MKKIVETRAPRWFRSPVTFTQVAPMSLERLLDIAIETRSDDRSDDSKSRCMQCLPVLHCRHTVKRTGWRDIPKGLAAMQVSVMVFCTESFYARETYSMLLWLSYSTALREAHYLGRKKPPNPPIRVTSTFDSDAYSISFGPGRSCERYSGFSNSIKLVP